MYSFSITNVRSALRTADVRDRVKIFASGKLITPDRIAVVLEMGADLVNLAHDLMSSVALRCQFNTCPVGVANVVDGRFSGSSR